MRGGRPDQGWLDLLLRYADALIIIIFTFVYANQMNKRRCLTFALLAALARAEERSIMNGATMIDRDLYAVTMNANAICDGGYKSWAFATPNDVSGGMGHKEFVIALPEAKSIKSAFVQNIAYDFTTKSCMGESALYVGTDTGAFSADMTKCSDNFFDSGFHSMNCHTQGTNVAVRRNGISACDNYYHINEVRLFQTTNLLELPDVTISAPAPTAPQWAATNLITNFARRTPGNDLKPLIDWAGTTATWESCFKTGAAQLSVEGNKLIIMVDLGKSYFQHAVLAVQDLFSGIYVPDMNDPLKFFQNYEIYIGDSPNWADNPKVPGGPHMRTDDPNSYVSVSGGPMWKFGNEVWCNMEGRYMAIVADLTHLAGQTSTQAPNGYEMNLCHLAVFGARYKRANQVPDTLKVLTGTPHVLDVEKITADETTPIANTLDIMLRQKAGTELPWVTFTQDNLVTKVNIAPDLNVPPGDYTIVLESFDVAGGVQSPLKTDRITVTVAQPVTVTVAQPVTVTVAQPVTVTEAQPVTVQGCPITADQINVIASVFQTQPLIFNLQARAAGFQSKGYSDKINFISDSLGYDAKAERLCGTIAVELSSSENYIKLEAAARQVTVTASAETEAASYDRAKLTIAIGSAFSLRIPIIVTFFDCTITNLSFEQAVKWVTYKLGSSTFDLPLPAVRQRPNCGVVFKNFTIESIESSLAREQVLTAVTLVEQALRIQSDDIKFLGNSATLTIAVVQDTVQEAGRLTIKLAFAADPPAFDTSRLSVQPITCSPMDDQWSLQVPPVPAVQLSSVAVELLSSTAHSELFKLESGVVTINQSQLKELIEGRSCPDAKTISLEFRLASERLGESKQVIEVPVQSQSSTAELSTTAGGKNSTDPGAKTFDGWKVLVDQASSTKKNKKRADTNQPARLRVSETSISSLGVLKVSFSKKILLNGVEGLSGQRLLADKNCTDVIRAQIVSTENDSDLGKSVKEVMFHSFDAWSVTFNITFANVTAISMDIQDPDILEVTFTSPLCILDAETKLPLDAEFRRQTLALGSQRTLAEYEEMVELAEKAANASIGVIFGQLILLFALKKVLFSVWILILTLQFLVIMASWQIRYSFRVQLALRELKRITLGEFVDQYQVGTRIAEFFGITPSEDSIVDEKVGSVRLGTSSVFSNVGPTLIIGTAAFLTIVRLIVCIVCICKRCHCSEERRKALRQKVFFNPIIRYFFLNTLKLATSCLVVFKASDSSKGDTALAVLLLAILLVLPVASLCILKKWRSKLAQDDTKNQIGTLYKGKNVKDLDHKAHVYAPLFFFRRLLFVVASVFAFDHPQIQMIVHHVLTMATIVVLAHERRAFETQKQRFVEIGSEALLHLISVLLSQFAVQNYGEDVHLQLEAGVFTAFALLVLLNLGFVFMTLYEDCQDRKRQKAWQARKELFEQRQAANMLIQVKTKPAAGPVRVQSLDVVKEEKEQAEESSVQSIRAVASCDPESAVQNKKLVVDVKQINNISLHLDSDLEESRPAARSKVQTPKANNPRSNYDVLLEDFEKVMGHPVPEERPPERAGTPELDESMRAKFKDYDLGARLIVLDNAIDEWKLKAELEGDVEKLAELEWMRKKIIVGDYIKR